MSISIKTLPRKPIFDVSGESIIDNSLWIDITIHKMTHQTLNPRDFENHIQKKTIEKSYRLLAPNEIQENITHSWDVYDNLIGRASDLIKRYQKSTGDISTLASGLDALVDGGNTTGRVNQLLSGPIEGANYKVDSPLVYKDSNRREYTFMFQLVDQGDIQEDILNPVNDFRKYSSASNMVKGKMQTISIEFPHIFTLKSIPYDIINVKYAALIAVQPNYLGPYRNGLPSKCELTLTFRDLLPLYESSWGDGVSKVSTRRSG